MLLKRVVPLLAHRPKSPDFHQCDPIYGENIKPFDCQLAVEVFWPSGDTPVHYYFEDPSPSNAITIPKYNKHGSCNIAIEPAGPRYGKAHGFASYLTHRPNELKALAGYVIEECANKGEGIGGFVTLGMDALERYVAGVVNEDWENAKDYEEGVSNNGAFLTISINGADRTEFHPGDTDPWVPGYLSMYAARLGQPFNEKLQQYQWIATIYRRFSEIMSRGGELTWFSLPPISFFQEESSRGSGESSTEEFDPDIQGKLMDDPEKMVYQCDATLGGGPDPVDCEKLSWSGLKTPDTVETLEAGKPKFFSEGTCALGISSPVPVTITWAHILTAFATLNNLCVQNPIKSVKGGRAYYGQQTLNSWFNGRKKVRRDSVGGVNGTDALPPGINATIFRHEETSSLPCEWVLAQEGKNLTGCGAG